MSVARILGRFAVLVSGAIAFSAVAAAVEPASDADQYGLADYQIESVSYVNSCDCGTCASSADCGCCVDDGCGLLGYGLIKPSDHCYDDFISPMTNPVYFEDPRNLTELRPIFLQHKVPLAAGGGDIQLYALQFRAALTDRLSLIAPKDGYAVSTNPLIADGWADVAAGLKYLIYSDPAAQRLLSGGLTYTMPVGSPRTLQARGDGDFHMFLTGGAEFLEHAHVISASGFRLPANDNEGSQLWYWSNHFDYQVLQKWYLFNEYNWYHWMKSGNIGLAGVEGGDLFNLGSTGVAGNDIVTGAFGVKMKPSSNTELGVAWELPLTDRRDVLENRITVDAIFRY